MSLMNDTLRSIAQRYSCRAYEDRAPEPEKLEAIALAAAQAPSGMNVQPWQIVVITDKALIDEMDVESMRMLAESEDKTAYNRFVERGGKMFYNAPCMFMILQKPGSGLDCGIVSENIALAATSLGLGNVICGMAAVPLTGEKGDCYKEKIGFPDGWEFGMAVLVGYAKAAGAPHAPDMSKIRYLS